MKKIYFLSVFLVCFIPFQGYSQNEEIVPIVFLHGMWESGDAWVKPVQQKGILNIIWRSSTGIHFPTKGDFYKTAG